MSTQHDSTKANYPRESSCNGLEPDVVHIPYTDLIAANNSFQLPMTPITAKKPKRTISMLSLKVHVDKGDYQNVAKDDFDDAGREIDQQELLAGI